MADEMSPPPGQVPDLVARVAAGDREAIVELLARYRSRLRRMVALRLDPRLQGRVDASDVIQEGYLDAIKRLEEYIREPSVPFYIWLRFLVGQRVSEYHRRYLVRPGRDVGREVSIYRGAMPGVSSGALAARLLGKLTSPTQAAVRRAQDPVTGGLEPHGPDRPRDPGAAPLRADDERRRRGRARPGEGGGEQAVHAGAGTAREDPRRSSRRSRRRRRMNDATSDRDPFEVIAESFLARYRDGERPSIEELAARHPDLAGPIRKLLPALVRVERDLSVDEGVAVPLLPAMPDAEQRIGDYRILRELGRGGMGLVYEAEQVSLGRRVALKVLPAHIAGDRVALERFRREAKAAARLHHTNIVPVFEVGHDADLAFYAMQFIQGQGLDQVIDELRRVRDPGRKSDGPDHTRTDSSLASATGALMAASAGLRSRWMAESLLTGRLLSEAPATGLAGTQRLDSDRTLRSGSADMREGHPRAAPGVDHAGSAVLPGGTHVSEIDTSGRRQPFFRSVAQIGRQAAQGLAMPTPAASSTVTSSPRTCSWIRPGLFGSPTSAWPRPTTTA